MIDNKYDFQLTEREADERRKEHRFTKAQLCSKSLLLPPPNITGVLHLGHAYGSVLQDLMVRHYHSLGEEVFWAAGLDHAGIATQRKVEELKLDCLDNLEKKRSFTVREWYPKIKQEFVRQWEELGLLIDSSRATFTLDDNVQRQVKEAFIKLYEEGLIFQDNRLVNWDPKMKSVLSEIEVEHSLSKSTLYYLKYQLKDSQEFIEVATSRPETCFVDAALFINPTDERYLKYLNKTFLNPFGLTLILLADKAVKKDFGSGVLKCTPAHDQVDLELAKKHRLPVESACDERGVLREMAEEWSGREIWSVRAEVVKVLKSKGMLIKEEVYETSVARSTVSKETVECLLSKQWFLDLPRLIERVEELTPNFLDQIAFLPKNCKKDIKEWKNKARSWCISRQLWWGHPIPAWHHKKTGEVWVGKSLCECVDHPTLEKRWGHRHRSAEEWEPDNGVLDTWFSSALWPVLVCSSKRELFSPRVYPFTSLVTGYDILFFWVFRMIVLSSFFKKVVPFKNVFLHGLVRDEKGKKMSKSFGNGVEPKEIVERFGRDSFRWFCAENTIWGSDLVYDENKLKGSWRFCQKIWSIANYLLTKTDVSELKKINLKDLKL